MNRFRDLFPQRKPIIAMAHLPSLPGTPLYDCSLGMRGITESVRRDLKILLSADFDAIMFCNEGDRPYLLHAEKSGIAAMSHVVSVLAPKDRPFGVDFLWDAEAALGIAMATGASFIREVATGVYESDMGLWHPDAGSLLRERSRLRADSVAVLMNVEPEFASSIGSRSPSDIALSVAVSSLADAILVSGPMAGKEPRIDDVRKVKEAVGTLAPVLVNTGAKSTNIVALLDIVDGVIVGSDLKQDGNTWNPVDPERVSQFLRAAGR